MVAGFFVYGTLKVGHGNAGVVKHLFKSAREARISGMAIYNCGRFPGMVQTGAGTDYVYGEFQTFTDMDAALERLDMLEGYREGREQNLYNRVVVPVELANGEEVEAYTYVFGNPEALKERAELIPDGVWRKEHAQY